MQKALIPISILAAAVIIAGAILYKPAPLPFADQLKSKFGDYQLIDAERDSTDPGFWCGHVRPSGLRDVIEFRAARTESRPWTIFVASDVGGRLSVECGRLPS